MSEQNKTGAPAGFGQMTVWDAIRSRRDVRAFLARRLLGFPEDKTCAFLIPLGYPAGR
jgi:hypothetical protein